MEHIITLVCQTCRFLDLAPRCSNSCAFEMLFRNLHFRYSEWVCLCWWSTAHTSRLFHSQASLQVGGTGESLRGSDSDSAAAGLGWGLAFCASHTLMLLVLGPYCEAWLESGFEMGRYSMCAGRTSEEGQTCCVRNGKEDWPQMGHQESLRAP